jgi:pSer/pThr/pTyr-binding forkhead associated (FHA) protein
MQGKMTKVYSPETTKEFFFDYSYWSHDGFVEDPDSGMMVPDSPSSIYSDQRRVFDDLGVGVLNNAFEGYHCCLFAYGQTGSGKSYSMVGYGKNKGIIPIVCEEIFKRIESVNSKSLQCEVSASMLEIYNEQIQDLLKPPNERVKGGLKVREDKMNGVFVQDLSKTPCSSYEEISEVLDKGNSNRTVAATMMNATSSRAHTVLTISFTQIVYDDAGKPFNRKQSNINLVDLAGSERASKTGATGDTLKEGSNINKSLSTLGRVITALAKKASGSKEMIPYRESSLTRILQNALGGNSKTTMIAAISPATFNIEETISTLRYADQVKAIKNQAIVNETPQEKLIRELKEENLRLKAMLEGKMPESVNGSGEDDLALREEFERQIQELKRATEEAQRTWQDKIKENEEKKQLLLSPSPRHKPLPSKVVIKTPHLSNLNEDPLLSGHICHGFSQKISIIGKKNPAKPPNILIEGLGIGIDHCTIEVNDDQYKIIPSSDPSLKTTLNGKILEKASFLQHQDRIRFGNHNFFLFVDPEELSNDSHDWEFAVKEAHEEEVKLFLGKQEEELKAKEDEMKKKLEAELEENKRKMEEEKKKLEELAKSKSRADEDTQKALVKKEKEIIERQRKMQEEMRQKERELRQHEEGRLAMEELKKALTHAIHQINEANERAVLLGKNVFYEPEIYREAGTIGTGMKNTKVRVKVVHPEISEDFKIYWEINKLDARLIDMQDICNQLQFGADINDILDYDPFTEQVNQDTFSYHLIGHAYVYLENAYYLSLIEDDQISIINDKGGIKGTLSVTISPYSDQIMLEEFESMKDMIGKDFSLALSIHSATGLPSNYSTNVYCQYSMQAFGNEFYKTEPYDGTETSPSFNYYKVHKFLINPEVAEEFLTRALIISIYGDITKEKKASEIKKLKETSKTNYSVMPGMINLRDNIDEDESFDATLMLNDPKYDIKINGVPNEPPSFSSEKQLTLVIPKNDNEMKNVLKNADKRIRDLEEEQKRKEREFEKEYQKRLKNIERAEKNVSEGKAPNKSSCCQVV